MKLFWCLLLLLLQLVDHQHSVFVFGMFAVLHCCSIAVVWPINLLIKEPKAVQLCLHLAHKKKVYVMDFLFPRLFFFF